MPTTIPFTASRPSTPSWSPTNRDRTVFQWVKFDGHKQSWVASQLGIDQSTVSRMVDRYERWIARGGASAEGAPSRDERLRSQRWLTYERNEWILTSALRIAGEMEHQMDISRSTITHSPSSPSQESQVRTEHKVLDRSGLAARFLRLAHRINMDQLQLVERDPLPDLDPLSFHDLGDDEPSGPTLADTPPDATRSDLPPSESANPSLPPREPPTPPSTPADDRASAPSCSSSPSPMPSTHNPGAQPSSRTPDPAKPSATKRPPEKTNQPAYAVALSPPEPTARRSRLHRRRRPRPANKQPSTA
jgi:hypothetical protein